MRLVAASAALLVAAGFAAAGDARDDAKVELGRRLFFDPTAGRGRLSCAACHVPSHAFADPRGLSEDEDGRPTLHRAGSLVDLPDGPLGWDGEFDGLRDAAADRVLSAAAAFHAAVERSVTRAQAPDAQMGSGMAFQRALFLKWGYPSAMRFRDSMKSGLAAPGRVGRPSGGARIAQGDRYTDAFRAAFGDDRVTDDRVVDALAAFVRSLRSTESPFDRFRAGDPAALSESAKRGAALFVGNAGCAKCHLVAEGGARPPLTDGAFHALASQHDGRAATTFRDADRGAFRTPSLRDVARRGPWMHDGAAGTLDEAVRLHKADGAYEPSDADLADLVELMKAMSGDAPAGAAPERKSAPLRVRVRDADGGPRVGLTIRATPFGERFADDEAAEFTATTDADGVAVVPRPATSHALLEADGSALGLGQPVPDLAQSVEVIVTPKGEMHLHVRFPAGTPLPDAVRFGRSGGGICADGTSFRHVLRLVRRLRDDVGLYVGSSPGYARDTADETLSWGPADAETTRAVSFRIGDGVADAVDLSASPESVDADSRRLFDLLKPAADK